VQFKRKGKENEEMIPRVNQTSRAGAISGPALALTRLR
jgi:hypothetical protein